MNVSVSAGRSGIHFDSVVKDPQCGVCWIRHVLLQRLYYVATEVPRPQVFFEEDNTEHGVGWQ